MWYKNSSLKSSSDLGHPILAVTHGQANNSQGEARILCLLSVREGIHGLLCTFRLMCLLAVGSLACPQLDKRKRKQFHLCLMC